MQISILLSTWYDCFSITNNVTMYQNPEFYAAAGGTIGGTLGGLYSSYGYVPPKIESADGMVYQVLGVPHLVL